MNLGKSVLAVVTLWVLLAAGGGYLLTEPAAPEAALQRLWLDLGLGALLIVGLGLLIGAQTKRYPEVIEMLRALSTGARERRLTQPSYGALQEIAEAANDIAAALSENDDPNLGPVKTRRRAPPPPPRKARTSADLSASLDDQLSEHPELGEVRVMSKERQAELLAQSEAARKARKKGAARTPPEEKDAPKVAQAPEEGPAPSESAAGTEDEAGVNDTVIEPAPPQEQAEAKAEGDDSQDLRELFEQFIALKREHNEDTSDLDYESFAQTLTEQGEQLVTAHSCRSVRFEIAVQDGAVSLQPHLLR